MSQRRLGTCGAPGPGRAHCTDYAWHRYSCYDAGDDVSFNDRQEWLTPHDCEDVECRDIGYCPEEDQHGQ